jgi:protein-S-isoprenylcysteine O-methyltransferase Ste14
LKKYASYILPASLLTGIIILGCRKFSFHNGMWKGLFLNGDAVIICIYAFWLMFEIRVSRRDFNEKKVSSDYGTREFYGFSHALTILSALWFKPIWITPGIYHLIGFFIFIFGIFFRSWAIQTLGKYYSHIVRKLDGHKIINTGPYKFLRHPAYSGMITAHIGITIFYFNYITLLIFLFLFIPSIIVRIIIEEKTLINIKDYLKFFKNTKRIIPYLW